nr:atp-dependent rna helicase mtr4 [Quercus suber]
MDELFDVFDETSARSSEHDKKSKKSSKKRAASGEVKGANTNGVGEEQGQAQRSDVPNGSTGDHHSDAQARDPKRQRRDDEPEPLVTDTFETEQSREIAASAGLQASKEDKAVVISHQVRHQVSLPPDWNYVPLSQHKPPETPARTWPFTLDPFQQTSITSIQRNESVLVSAHTSAGKTVVAEYAIAQCLKNNQRVIYTSPIKALSNQKYREFHAEFGDAGLMTGDVTINPTATCLVMTTEILRSMLYRGSEIMREVAWVIFDEVHYLRDKSRGVVWEETIILLPDKVRYVFLSATIPNAMQFAEWITKTHNQPCHVVYTDFRPTPLQHYFFPAGADGIHLIVDEKGVFREDNFNKAMTVIADKAGDDGSNPLAKRKGKGKDKRTNQGGQKDGPTDIYKIVKMIMMKNYNPVIVFSFSKRECENLALQMSQLAFNDDSEKAMVSKVFDSAIEMLSDEDKELPQIQHLLPLLRRGIGIHHSGLLPILKETIEILFQEGLIKVLFATETFSIGLNMPAKTVVFTSVRKFDGTNLRWVTPSEFIQMSGRAGRRGLDDRGIVIMMIDEKMEPAVAKEIVRGEQDKLNSAFYLGYNMILNLMRVEGINPEYMLEKCFFQFQNQASAFALENQLTELEQKRASMIIDSEPEVKEYFDLEKLCNTYGKQMRDYRNHPQFTAPFLQSGRMVWIKWKDYDFKWGMVVNSREEKPGKKHAKAIPPLESVVVDVALFVAADSASLPSKLDNDLPPGVRPPAPGEKSKLEVVPVWLSTIWEISKVKVFPLKDLRSKEGKDMAKRTLMEVYRRHEAIGGIPPLDPISEMGIRDPEFKTILTKLEKSEHKFRTLSLQDDERLPALYDQYCTKMDVTKDIKTTRKKIEDALSVLQLDELKKRKRVLRRLDFINDADVIQPKARVACEISTGDEIVLAELLFNRFFNELSPEHCAAALSCFICEEKSKEAPTVSEQLMKMHRDIIAQAQIVAKISIESKVIESEEDFLEGFKLELMEVVYAWTQGASFAQICKMTDVYEGSLIRLFRRLEELLRQLGQAARVMGSEELEQKFEAALLKVRRDIVAAQSLYL